MVRVTAQPRDEGATGLVHMFVEATGEDAADLRTIHEAIVRIRQRNDHRPLLDICAPFKECEDGSARMELALVVFSSKTADAPTPLHFEEGAPNPQWCDEGWAKRTFESGLVGGEF